MAVDKAAANGHIEIVQFLCTNRNELFSVDAIVLAANHGHIILTKWLCKNFNKLCIELYSKSCLKSTELENILFS